MWVRRGGEGQEKMCFIKGEGLENFNIASLHFVPALPLLSITTGPLMECIHGQIKQQSKIDYHVTGKTACQQVSHNHLKMKEKVEAFPAISSVYEIITMVTLDDWELLLNRNATSTAA